MLFNKTNLTGMAAAMAIAIAGGTAQAQETTLTISTWAPPTHGINSVMFPELIRLIEEATEGRVTAEMKYNLAPPPAQADIVSDGIADITWIAHGYTPGRFPSASMAELPGFGGSSEALAVAYWRTFEQFFAEANEHRDLRVLAVHTHGDGMLHSSTRIENLDQVAGMKFRVGGGVAGHVGEALGLSAINVPAPRVYETLASNAADGAMMPMEAKVGFRLTEVAPHSYDMPSGFYRTSMATVMNQDAFDALRPEDQAALNELFGEELSRITGAMWDQFDEEGLTASEAAGTNTMTIASEADQLAWAETANSIVDEIVDGISATGIDGDAAYAFFRSEFDRLNTEQ
ncbi:TRAP transporter substrate-binding protein [Cochlodiniinecator piscidefendens]|uniref:TRAP transporter substrate-binding protein n=1 Tax=Cochlodiniinecator piscidefendens TaxID=2715756 RepID=UPI00140DA7EB|nr:TRAP transporter substrate-binding protein [Cochlodiniinecator piscidefendens]